MAIDQRRMTTTLRDVAERAGVSISTASRALTGTRRVHPELIDRVETAASDLGYRPNQAARSLRMARTMTFGVIFNRLESPVMLDLLDGLNAGSADREYTLLVTSARGDMTVYRHLIRRLFERETGLKPVLPRRVRFGLKAWNYFPGCVKGDQLGGDLLGRPSNPSLGTRPLLRTQSGQSGRSVRGAAVKR